MAAPEHPKVSPEEAARRIREAGESTLLSEAEIADSLRQHVEEFGPAEIVTGEETYTVELPDAEPYVPDLEEWAGRLAHEARGTPTDYQGHPDVPEDAAVALVETLSPEDLRRLTDALLEAAPGFAERVADTVLTDLTEEIARREDPHFVHATLELIAQIQADWRQQA